MTAVAPEVVPHGRFIYAFCNVRTNQVLYSLSRTLDNSALKQLPDLGANHTPPVLRKDLWRPLYQVELPSTPDGAKQGLHALKKLREYRKLHELSWEQTSMMTRNFTDKEIEKEKKKLENRGGSKKETVYDIIKRHKHKMKVKMVMDQKANSIADLAAVLLEQNELGAKTREAKRTRATEWRATQLAEMERLAQEAEDGGMEKVSNRVDMLRKTLEQMLKDGTEGHRNKLREDIADARRQFRKMEHAVHVAKQVNPEAGEIERLAQQAEDGGLEKITDLIEALQKLRRQSRNRLKRKSLKDQITKQEQQLRWVQSAANAVKEVRATSAPTDEGPSEEPLVAAYKRELLLSFAEEFDPTKRDPSNLPKHGWARREVERRNRPTFTAEGITVKWANIMDAEYASSWPDAVQHERMGFTTRSFPRVDAETVAEYRALQWKGRRENFQLGESIANKVERIRAEMGLQARSDKPWKLDQIKKLGSEFLPGSDPSDVDLVKSKDGEVAAAQEAMEEAVSEDPDRLENIQKEILSQVQQRAAQESWDKRAELDLRRARNKHKFAPLPAAAAVDQQPTL